MVKFGALIVERSLESAAHIPPDAYVDYAALNDLVEVALEGGVKAPPTSSSVGDHNDGGCWEAAFHETYLRQVEKVKEFLRSQLDSHRGPDGVTRDGPVVTVAGLREYVLLNERGLDKISKKFDKARAFLSVRRKLLRGRHGSEEEYSYKHPATTLVLCSGYLRSDNAALYKAEIAPLRDALFELDGDVGADGADGCHDLKFAPPPPPGSTLLDVRSVGTIVFLAFGFLSAAHRHTVRLDEHVVLPWHAGLALALGWPTVLLGWYAGRSNVGPRSAFEFLVAVACTAATCVALAGSDPPPFPASLGAWAWWTFLVAVSAANVRLLMGLYNRIQRLHEAGRGVSPYQTKLLWCTAAYVLGCFVRSVWPRIDVERICFFDNILSVTFVGRTLATIAELGFATQLSLVLHRLTSDLQHPKIARMNPSPCPKWMLRLSSRMSHAIVPLIAVAQIFCWFGVTTTRQIWHGIEESIWAFTVAAITPCAALIAHQCAAVQSHPGVLEEEENLARATSKAAPNSTASWKAHALEAPFACDPTFSVADGLARGRRFGTAGATMGPLFVAFMLTVDVPMYVERWRMDESQGTEYLTFREGLLDSLSCNEFSRDWDTWAEEVPWMSMYFSLCVWASVWMGWAAPALVLDDRDDDGEEDRAGEKLAKKRD